MGKGLLVNTMVHGSLSLSRDANHPYELAKHYLCKDSMQRQLFNRFEHAPKRSYTLHIVHDGNDHFDPNSDSVFWDPTSALRTTNGGHQSPALGLAHEIDHAVERRSTFSRLDNMRNGAYDNDEERRVIKGSERHAAATFGESIRTNHGGSLYRVVGPCQR